ncbi:RusA family crossover junction endodeoxyribonuclease [Ensifer aridi]|uniref:RusA family crossover junction endodeoxyribonuclease n=1 Tax=Ensifer aridi TaxID=1708715 RepID=UPI001FCD08EC|nr:RusA family crossover junction endodeoxyribonuclease [Ensifer aridi]
MRQSISRSLCTSRLRRQNMRQDLDNRSKAILDCLQHYGVIKNDNLYERLTMC